MVNYTNYQDLLESVNFIGGASQTALPNPGNDDRAEIAQYGNGVYQFYYRALTGLSDLDNLGYYDTANNDIGNDGIYDREYDELPSGNDPQLSANQLTILSAVVTGDAYSVTFSDVAKVDFNSGTTATADIVIGQTTNGGVIDSDDFAYTLRYNGASTELKHGDIWLNQEGTSAWDSTAKGSLGYGTMVHELGHSLGLGHTDGTPAIDSQQYSIMSYNLMIGMDPVGADNEVLPFGLQLLDIAALQEIYGRNYDTRDTDTTYSKATAFASTRPNDAFIYTIWDSDGTDEIDASGYTNPQGAVIDLRQGTFSSLGYNAEGGAAVDNLAVAFHTIVEKASGTANADVIIGNAWDNVLEGGAGNDRIFGDGVTVVLDSIVSQIKSDDAGYGTGVGEHDTNNPGAGPASDDSGADTIGGGAGDDLLYGGAGEDSYLYNLGDGDDRIFEAWDEDNTLKFGAGIDGADFTVAEVGDDLVFTMTAGGSVTFDGYAASAQGGDVTIDFDSASDAKILKMDSDDVSLTATLFDEIIIGNDIRNIINGGGGDDVIFAGAGDDDVFVSGGAGVAWGGAGNDELEAGGSGGSIFLYGEEGDDEIVIVGSGSFTVDMGSGNDEFRPGAVHSGAVIAVNDASGDDYYTALSFNGDYMINDISGNDYYFWSVDTGDISILDQGGEDRLQINITKNTLQSTSQVGDDLVLDRGFTRDLVIEDYFAGSANQIELVKFTDTDWFSLSDLVSGATLIFGTASAETLNGTAGGDALYGYDGDDTLNGDAGNDILRGGLGADALDGGDGTDLASYDAASEGVIVDMLVTSRNRGEADGDSYVSIEDLQGSAFDDTLRGDGGDNQIWGLAGHDTLWGRQGDDALYGQDGDDVLRGGGGADTLDGDAGIDTADYTGASAAVKAHLGDPTQNTGDAAGDSYVSIENLQGADFDDRLFGDAADNALLGGAGDDILWGGIGADALDGGADMDRASYTKASERVVVDMVVTSRNRGEADGDSYVSIEDLQGSTFNDTLRGDAGANRIWGFDGNDEIWGRNGNDRLIGQDGDDIIWGGDGNDTLSGSSGADTFEVRSNDVGDGIDSVTDFVKGEDKLDISDILDGLYTDGVDDIADFVQITDDGTDTTVAVDQNGGGNSFTSIIVVENTLWTNLNQMISNDTVI